MFVKRALIIGSPHKGVIIIYLYIYVYTILTHTMEYYMAIKNHAIEKY